MPPQKKPDPTRNTLLEGFNQAVGLPANFHETAAAVVVNPGRPQVTTARGQVVDTRVLAAQNAARAAAVRAAQERSRRINAQKLRITQGLKNNAPPSVVDLLGRNGIFSDVRDAYFGGPGGTLPLPNGKESEQFSGLTALSTAPGQSQTKTIADVLGKYTVPDRALTPRRLQIDPQGNNLTRALTSNISKDEQGNLSFNPTNASLNALFPGAGDVATTPLKPNPEAQKAAREAMDRATEEATQRIAAGVRRGVKQSPNQTLKQIQNTALQQADVAPEVRANFNLQQQGREAAYNLANPKKQSLVQQAIGLPGALVKSAVSDPLGTAWALSPMGIGEAAGNDIGGLITAYNNNREAGKLNKQIESLNAEKATALQSGDKKRSKQLDNEIAQLGARMIPLTEKTDAQQHPVRTVFNIASAGAAVGGSALKLAGGAPKAVSAVTTAPRTQATNGRQIVKQFVKEQAAVPAGTKTIQPGNRAVGRQLTTSTADLIGQTSPAGTKLGNAVKMQPELARRLEGEWTDNVQTLLSLNEKQYAAVAAKAAKDDFTGRTGGLAKMLRNTMDDIYFTANKTKGRDFASLKGFVPGRSDDAFAESVKATDIDRLAKARGISKSEASRILREKETDAYSGQRFGSFEHSRTSDSLNMDQKALKQYIAGAADAISKDTYFGVKGGKADNLLATISDQGGNSDLARELFNKAIGAKEQGTAGKILGNVRGFNTLTKLQSAAFPNLGQITNVASVYGYRNTGKAAKLAAKALRDPKSAEASYLRKTGVITENQLKHLQEGYGLQLPGKSTSKVRAKAQDFIMSPGFNPTESWNRTVAAFAGRETAKSGDDVVRAGQDAVRRTQFYVDNPSIPAAFTGPVGKTVAQFRTFQYNQTKFIYNELLKEAFKNKNPAPLARFVATGIPMGAGIRRARNVVTLKGNEKESAKDEIANDLDQVGGFGLFRSLYRGINPPKNYPDQLKASMLVSTLGGPTAGTATELGLGLQKLKDGDGSDLLRAATRMTPLVGPQLANLLSSKKNSEKSKGLEKIVNNYNALSDAGVLGGMKVTMSDDERKSVSRYINAQGNLNDKAVAEVRPEDREALIKYQSILQAGAGALSDAYQLGEKIRKGEKLSFDEFTSRRSINDKFTDEQLGGKENISRFLSGSADKQNAYLRWLEQSQGREAADRFIQTAQQYVGEAQGRRSNLDTSTEVFNTNKNISKADVARNYSEAATDFAGMNTADRIKLAQKDPAAAASLAQEALSFKQAQLGAGLITESSAKTATKSLTKLLSGDFSSSSRSQGSGSRSGGKKRSGRRSGRSRGSVKGRKPKMTVKKSSVRKPTVKKYTVKKPKKLKIAGITIG